MTWARAMAIWALCVRRMCQLDRLLGNACGAAERANAQTSESVAAIQGTANSGPSAEQLFNEARGKADEFEAAGWPPRGRFTISPERSEAYVDFIQRRAAYDQRQHGAISVAVTMQSSMITGSSTMPNFRSGLGHVRFRDIFCRG